MSKIRKIRQAVENCALRTALRVFFVFPVKKDRIVFNSFRGKQFSCNPKYISEYLRTKYPGEFELVWLMMDPEKFPELKELGYKVVKRPSIKYFYYALTARVFVVNGNFMAHLPPRKGQYDIRTWHGGGAYKRVGLSIAHGDAKNSLTVKLNQSRADLYLSSSKKFTELTLHDSFQYEGEIFEYGMPRNDMLIRGRDEALIARVKKAIGIPEDRKFVLYAPTFRQNGLPEEQQLDYGRLMKALSLRFGGEWRCAFRGHHVHSEISRGLTADKAVNVTDYPDMQELLMAADVLVTDYSSSIWDMSLTGKPCFLYATDLKSYQSERDFYYDIHTWPFPLAEDNDQLFGVITAFDAEKYARNIRAHHDLLGSCETGHATEKVCERICEVCKGEKK